MFIMADDLKWVVTLLTLFSFVLVCRGQIKPTPPPPGDIPVISNGIIYNLNYIPSNCRDPSVMSPDEIEFGTVIKGKRKAIIETFSPYKVRGNIEIAPDACLYIQPGTEFHFGPGFGMIVNGTLIARGSERIGGRIVMTKDPDSVSIVGPSNPFPSEARLVDGNTTRDGKLELFYHGMWRPVCTNFLNYSQIDANVTCRMLGFVGGNFTYHSYARNKTEYMLFQRPSCRGHENSLFDCVGKAGIQYGTHICDGQLVVGFECEGIRPDLAKDYWRGLEFYNATTNIIKEGNFMRNETLSHLEFLDIFFAGRDNYRGGSMNHGRAALSASPHVPLMNNVSITNSAYDGMNLTEVTGRIHIANSSLSSNRGHGIFIKTSVGRVLINMTDIDNNWGDGVKMYLTNYTIHHWEQRFPSSQSMCRSASLAAQVYPVLIYENLIDPDGRQPPSYLCNRVLFGNGKRITLHFLLMEKSADAHGQIRVFDGASTTSTPVLFFNVNNGTFPQSVTSKTDKLTIEFKYNLPPNPSDPRKQRCDVFYPCIRFLMEATVDEGIDYDLQFYNSSATRNSGYGVNVQDMRSKVHVNSSVVSFNKYGAGIRVYQGAGEVSINNTIVEGNVRCGINITYAGGYQLINRTKVYNNFGYGVFTEYERLNNSRFESEHKFEVVNSDFKFNHWTAFRMGNYCRGGQILINESHFDFNFGDAIEYLSCNISIGSYPPRNFSMAYSTFNGNIRHGVLISPLINTVGRMTNNSFTNHSLGVIRVDNGYDLLISKWYSKFRVMYEMFENTFEGNMGRYCVSLRLTQGSPLQYLHFKFNKVINNFINDTSPYLNPRNRANAPIVVSSGNVNMTNNRIHNPGSVRDIATHLIDPSEKINGIHNWWETIDLKYIYSRIFDNKDRFNLAEIDYYPVLRSKWLYGPPDLNTPIYRWDFARDDRIGGVLDVEGFTTDPGRNFYIVDKDIFILPGATLTIRRGTTLAFENSIGMVVHGRLKADGEDPSSPIIFKRFENEEEVAIENRTASVRLVDGADQYEGRVEVFMFDEWGNVCANEWTEKNSVVVCQQLGLTYNPEYGQAIYKTLPSNSSQKIHIGRVQCDEVDVDLVMCDALYEDQFQCNNSNLVYIRCQKPTWSGITIPAVPTSSSREETQFRHVKITDAGMLDYEEMMFSPALSIDYNFYKITGLIVTNSVSDGVLVKYANPHTENLFEHCSFNNNNGNGFVTRSPYLTITYTTMNHNNKAGFVYDPFFTEYEALSVRNFIYKNRMLPLLSNEYYRLGDNSMVFIKTDSGYSNSSQPVYMEIEVNYGFRITLQLLDYNPKTDVEKVIIYDSKRSNIGASTKTWEIEKDLVDFPLVSSTQYLTISLLVNGVRTDRLTFAAHSRKYSPKPLASEIKLFKVTSQNNDRGIVTKHYNNPSNERDEIFHRIKEEELIFDEVDVLNNAREAMYIPSLTKYHENLLPTLEEMTRPERLSSITYTIKNCKFLQNGGGIIADHNHVDFANNVWHWNISQSELRNIANGGLQIELPRVNDIVEKLYHSVLITGSYFMDSPKFVFAVNGYYANVTITSNIMASNICPGGIVMHLGGMEKNLHIARNSINNNQAKIAFLMETLSHSDFEGEINGNFERNEVVDNSPGVGFGPYINNNPVTYSVGLRGVQKIVMKRNIIDNPAMQYELLAGIMSLSLDTVLDVRENWWGSQYQADIRRKIFDFDDWNNYALAQYFPQLTAKSTDSDVALGSIQEPVLNLERLGGRITKDLSLPFKSTPYRVVSDLTIMPGTTFIIEPGNTLEFYPNVGILVLGQIISRGLPFARITMRPVLANQISRFKRAANQYDNGQVRLLRDTKGISIPANEGFLEIYNTSTKSWNIMCDESFNEKTAEVICRELGMETLNAEVRFTHLYDHYIFGEPQYFIKDFWAYSYYCKGGEDTLNVCMKRINYDIQTCIRNGNYTYIRCGAKNLPDKYEYWGNVRIAPPSYEEEIIPSVKDEDKSALEYVDIWGAGMLHGEKTGAVQSTFQSPIFSNLNITNCLLNGIDIVAPRYNVHVRNLNISNNLGYAVNMLILNGESRDSSTSSFIPLKMNTVPYFLHGLVDICKMEKEINIESRLIVYYKYSQTALDCVKVITSKRGVAIRFLQFNMYHDQFYRNIIEVFDGKDVTIDNRLAELTVNSSADSVKKRYLSSGNSISLHIHASPSFGEYGFIAEAVSYPLTGATYPYSDDHTHLLEHLALKGNEDGAIQYKNVGEINPSLYIDKCWIEGNGVGILNLTSAPVVDIDIQDTRVFLFEHNFVNRNKGGLYVKAMTQSVATHLSGNITNNVFSFMRHGEPIMVIGHPYQRFRLHENFIFNNTAGDFRDILHVGQVGFNATFNVFSNNTADAILKIHGDEKTDNELLFTGNMIFSNNCTARVRSTIKVGSGNPIINKNYLVNLENDYELEANRKITDIDDIDATENWWGASNYGYITGKIYDYADNNTLVSVKFDPFKVSDQSIIDGKCAPGWRLDTNRCYRYMGAALPYHKAIEFCQENGGYLGEVKDRESFFRYLIRTTESVYKEAQRTWVFAEVAPGFCSALQDNYIVAEQDCYLKFLPFVCEKDPYIAPPGASVLTLAIAVSAGVGGVVIIIIVVLIILWKCKSKRRQEEKFERTQSIRGSARSLNKSRSTMTMLSNAPSNRRFHDIDKYSTSAISSKSGRDSDDRSYVASETSLAKSRRSEPNGFMGSNDHLSNGNRYNSNGDIGNGRKYSSRDDLQNGQVKPNPRNDVGPGGRDSGRGRGRRLGGRINEQRQYKSEDPLLERARQGSRENLDQETNLKTSPRLNRSDDLLDRLEAASDRSRRPRLTDRKNSALKPVLPPKLNLPAPQVRHSPQSSAERKLIRHEAAADRDEDTDVGYTDDGFSENEFDDFTTTADEANKIHGDDDASTVMSFQGGNRPPNVENEINSIHMRSSTEDMTYQNFVSSPSVNLSSFHLSGNNGRPPTPPPPLDSNNAAALHNTSQSSVATNQSRPQPRPRPVPRSLQNSKDSMHGASEASHPSGVTKLPQMGRGVNPLHLSRESLNYLDNRQNWLTDKVPEKKQDSDEESGSSTEGGSTDGTAEEDEDVKKPLPPYDYSDGRNKQEYPYDPGYHHQPPPYASNYAPPSYDATFPVMQDSHYNPQYNPPGQGAYHQQMDPSLKGSRGSINHGYNSRSRENIPMTLNNDYMKSLNYADSVLSEDVPRKKGHENGGYEGSPMHSPGRSDMHSSKQSLENLNDYSASVHSLSYSRENLPGYGSARSLNRSRENVHGSLLYLDDNVGREMPGQNQPMETEI